MNSKKLKIISRKEFILLLLIILIGGYLRFPGILSNSFAFTYDVGRDLLAVNEIIQTHKLPLIGPTTGIPGVFYGPWWYYFLLPIFIITSGSPQAIAVAMGIIGILSIILSYIIGLKLGSKFLGLVFSSFVSISPVLVAFSSQIWNPNIAPFFVLVCLLLLIQIFAEKKSSSWIFLFLGITLAISVDLEIFFGLFFSVGVLLSLAIVKRKSFYIRNIINILLGALIILLPRVIFDLRHQFLLSKSFFSFVTLGGSEGGVATTNIIDRVGSLFNFFGSVVANDNKAVSLVILIFILAVIAYSYKSIPEIQKKVLITCSSIILVFLSSLLMFKHEIWPHYLVGLPIIFILVLSISINSIAVKSKNLFFSLATIFFILLVNLNIPNLVNNAKNFKWEGDASVYRNQLEVIDYIYLDAEGKTFKYVVYTPPVHDYTYRYLFNWYGQKQFGYIPQAKANLAYFILEPDIENPERLQDWLEEREGDGRIIKEERLKGGIIVQKRTQ